MRKNKVDGASVIISSSILAASVIAQRVCVCGSLSAHAYVSSRDCGAQPT